MSRLLLTAPSRLHFGLLASGPGAARQFGGLGLMVDAPGLVVESRPSAAWSASGPLADRALAVAERVAARLAERGSMAAPRSLTIRRAPPEHVGLGTGTQLGLSVAKLVAESAGQSGLDAPALAALAGRGLRSGVGLHGFDRGGLVVEGGHRGEGGIAPLLARLEFPPGWHALIVAPPEAGGLHGDAERRAFAALPPMPDAETDRLCRLVLLGALPSVVERDLDGFGAALEEIQHRVGSWFAPAQGGEFASSRLSDTVAWMRSQGLRGVGQSSWGPTLYGFTEEGAGWRADLSSRLRDRFDLGGAGLWTTASASGATIEDIPDRPPVPAS